MHYIASSVGRSLGAVLPTGIGERPSVVATRHTSLQRGATIRRAGALVVLVSLLAATVASGAEPRRGPWFPKARFGVRFHFLGGAQANLDRRMEGFDVQAVARQLHEIGADYLILTLGQNCGFYCSPNETYARYVGLQPGERLATRDLPMELADALDVYGIRLLLYLPMRSPQRDPVAMERLGDPGQLKDAPPEFTKRWSNVIRITSNCLRSEPPCAARPRNRKYLLNSPRTASPPRLPQAEGTSSRSSCTPAARRTVTSRRCVGVPVTDIRHA